MKQNLCSKEKIPKKKMKSRKAYRVCEARRRQTRFEKKFRNFEVSSTPMAHWPLHYSETLSKRIFSFSNFRNGKIEYQWSNEKCFTSLNLLQFSLRFHKEKMVDGF